MNTTATSGAESSEQVMTHSQVAQAAAEAAKERHLGGTENVDKSGISSSSKWAGGAGMPMDDGQIYGILMKDHRALEPLLTDLVGMSMMNETLSNLLKQINELLIPHSRAEEEIFYNAIRASDPENKQPLHGYKEHADAELMIRMLQSASVIGVEWTTKAKQLREALLNHIQEEETEVFARARKIFTDQEARDLGQAFLVAKSKAQEQGAVGGLFHLVANLMPPWLADRLSNRKDPLCKDSACKDSTCKDSSCKDCKDSSCSNCKTAKSARKDDFLVE